MFEPNSAPQPEGQFQSNSSLVPAMTGDATAEYYLRVGKTLYHSYLARSRQQDLDAAVQHFQKAVEIEPNLAEAYVQLASALWDQGVINLELAQFYCETALKLDPNQADANLYLGYFLQRSGLWDDAATQFTMAIKKQPWHSARPRIALGNLYLKQALNADTSAQKMSLSLQGIVQFVSGCSLLPIDKQTCSILSEALITDGQVYTLEFLADGFKRVRLPQISRQLYRLGTTLLPKEALFFHLLGDECLFDLNAPQDAIRYYTQAQALDPNNVQLLKKLGKAYANAKEVSKAVETLNVVVEQQLEFDSVYQLAQLHAEEKAYFKALYYFKEAEKQRPHYPYVHSNMAYVLYKMEDIEGALEEYKTALDLGTDPIWLSTVAQTIGTIAFQLVEDAESALEYLHQALHYNPENHEALSLLADVYFELGHMDMAIGVYKTLLEIDPHNADCYSNMGYILWQVDENQAAIDAYMAAIYYDKTNPIVHNNLGVIYLDDEQNPEKAYKLFETALALKPDYTLACFNLARSYHAMGRTMEAAEKYSQALKLNHLNPEVDEVEITDRLDRLFD